MKLVLLCSISVRYVCWLINSPLVCSPTSKSLFHVKNPPAEELPQLCSSNHLEIFFVARKHLKRFFFFTPSLNLLAVAIVCPLCPKIACMGHRCSRSSDQLEPRSLQSNYCLAPHGGRPHHAGEI